MTPAQFFKCLSDETRLRCVALLQKQGKLCVCELTAALDVPQPKISRHLALLRQQGLLLDSREGQWVYYQINPTLSGWAFPILENTLAAIENNSTFQADFERLQVMKTKPELAVCC
ncbi:MAG: metalloregulator ArsR/SmtB family transcription factor [Methylococcales bacterium]|nr:metalloregulator ArsR/SmtB family transcription factor [Methylococcales bacterium]